MRPQGRRREATEVTRELNDRTRRKRQARFEELIEGVNFNEDGLKKAFQVLEKVEG